MLQDKMLGIIPARSGSKGLKDKNIKNLNGKPMLGYTIEAAKESGVFAEIMVSTDSEKYAEIARSFGAEVPFLRSKELSGDAANSWDVVRDVVRRYEERGIYFDYIMLLQPTSPLRTSEDIKKAISVLEKEDCKVVISVCEAEHPPVWTNRLTEKGTMDYFFDNPNNLEQRQKQDKQFRINGAIYVVEKKHLMESENLFDCDVYPVIMDKRHSIDVDDDMDFCMAEFIMKVNF